MTSTDSGWQQGKDVLGHDYDVRRLAMAPDYEGPVEVSIVRHARSERPSRAAVLWIHGFADYFFHHHVATALTDEGYGFYALDLRRYGRSLSPHQTPNFCRSFDEYNEEVEAAVRLMIEDGHRRVFLMGHSTGGLVALNWWHSKARSLEPSVGGLILNSPFVSLPAAETPVLGPLVRTALGAVSRVAPYYEVPRDGVRLYGHSLHRESNGEWEYDLRWKPHNSFPARAGWLAAVLRAQRAVVARPLETPSLVLTAERSGRLTEWSADALEMDVVLSSARIREVMATMGPLVEQVEVPAAMHDVMLSNASAREIAIGHVLEWLSRMTFDGT